MPPPLMRWGGGPGSHTSVWLWHRDWLHHDRRNTVLPHTQVISRLWSNIKNPARNVGTPILNPDRRLLLVPQVLYSGDGAERQAPARSNVQVRIEPLAIGHLPAVELPPIIGRSPTLRPPGVINDLPTGYNPCPRPTVVATG